MDVLTLQQAVDSTGLTLPSNIDNFPLDVQAYIKLRIITAAFNDDNGLDMFTAEKYGAYPGPTFDVGGCSFPYWNYGNTPFYCGARIGLQPKTDIEWRNLQRCGARFSDLWTQLWTANNVSMALPSNISDLLPDVQAYIRLRISATSLNSANGGGVFFPCFSISSGQPEDIVGIRKKTGGEEIYQNRIRVANWAFMGVIESAYSLRNLGLKTEALANTSASNNEQLWKQLVGIVI